MGERITDEMVERALAAFHAEGPFAKGTEFERASMRAALTAALPSPAPDAGGAEVVAWVSYTDERAPICLRVAKSVYTNGLEVYSDDPVFEGEIALCDARLLAEAEQRAAAMEAALRAVASDRTWRTNDNTLWPKITAALLAPTTTDEGKGNG